MPTVSNIFRGFFIACSFENTKILKLQAKLNQTQGFDIHPLIETCTGKNKREHILNVHASHIKALEMCSQRNWAPCVVFESDATWEGNLYTSLSLAANENDNWDIVVMGITPVDIQSFMGSKTWQRWPRKTHSLQLAGTGGGCQAYMASNPGAFAEYLKKKNVVWLQRGAPETPCIEYIFSENMKIILATDVPVMQSNKKFREGTAWEIDQHGNIIVKYQIGDYQRDPIFHFFFVCFFYALVLIFTWKYLKMFINKFLCINLG